MSKLPYFPFYPGDWRKDPDLSRCSKAAKGVWVDMMCLLWECEERGVFISAKNPWSDDDIAMAIGGNVTENLTCLRELLAKGVAGRDHRGAVYSRRIVRDEQIRQQAVIDGLKGGNPTLKRGVKGGVNPPVNPKANPTPTLSESVAVSVAERSETTPPNPPAGGGSPGQAGHEEGETAEDRDLYDHVKRTWQAKKKNPLRLRNRDKRELTDLASTYQPWGVKALWDVYLEDKDKFVLEHGHSVRIFFDQIQRLLDHPRYRQLSAQYQPKIGLQLSVLNIIGGKA